MILNKQFKVASTALLLVSSVAMASAAEITAGFNLNTSGLGAFIAGDTGWSFYESDKLRWRASAAGFDTDEFYNEEFSDNDFSGDLKSSGVQLGLDWYPFQNQFFLSGGIVSFDRDFDLSIVPQRDFTVGNQLVRARDNVGLQVKLDHKSEAPYISVGVGNRHAKESGFAIFGEVGVMFPVDDAAASLALTGNDGLVSAADIALEKKELEDDVNDAQLIATFGIGYHF